MLVVAASACRRPQALARAGLTPLVARAEGRAGAPERHAVLDGLRARRLFETERVFQAALVTGALTTDAAKGSDAPFDPRIQRAARPPRPDRRGGGAARD